MAFWTKFFNLIKMQQKCFSDGFYKTQVRNCQLIATVRILLSVKVKLTLNTLSGLSHKRSWIHETFLEELWRKEHGQSCV